MSRKLAEKEAEMDAKDEDKYRFGIATEMWLELKGTDKYLNLWLLVENAWLILDPADDKIHQAVQNAFSSETLEVVVWYERPKDPWAGVSSSFVDPPPSGGNLQYRTPIVGLVIRSK